MDAEQKFRSFVAGTLSPDRDLAVEAAAALGVRLHRTCLGTMLCEPAANIASGRLGRRQPAFIGMHSYMNDGGYLRGAVFIGRYCSIGRRVSVGGASHRMDTLSTSPATRRDEADAYTPAERDQLFGRPLRVRADHTFIGNDVWIGDGAVVLAGIQVGHGAVIGANAVVDRDVLPYEVVAGIPARPLRLRFPPDIVQRLLASRWWELAPETLRSLPTSHVPRFLDAVTGLDSSAVETLRVVPAS